MPRLEWNPSDRMGVEAQCGGYTLHVLENPSVADLMAGHATMYEWRVYRHSWVMQVGQRGRDEPRNTMPTMAAAQDAAEAEAARLLAEDVGVVALLAGQWNLKILDLLDERDTLRSTVTDLERQLTECNRMRVDALHKATAEEHAATMAREGRATAEAAFDRACDERETAEITLGDVANALGVPLADRPEGIAGVAKAWRERAEAAEARVATLVVAVAELEAENRKVRDEADDYDRNGAWCAAIIHPLMDILGEMLGLEGVPEEDGDEDETPWWDDRDTNDVVVDVTNAVRRMKTRAEAAEARVAEMAAALRWRSVGEELPAAGQCVMVPNPMSGMNSRKEAPRYVERYYNHPHRIWLDLDGRTVPPPTHWRPLLPGPEVKS